MSDDEARWTTWRAATQEALYGGRGFYRRGAGPAAHFRTSVHASPLFAQAVLGLARRAGLDTIVDVGAGRGELLTSLRHLDPVLHLVGVDVAERPDGLPPDVAWHAHLPDTTSGLLVANEWLDNVPVDVAERTDNGVRLVLVDPVTGQERADGDLAAADQSWLARWWPLNDAEVGDRAEVGHPRDDAWAGAVASLGRGLAVAVDYAHRHDDRPSSGTLVGYRDGRAVLPVPDGFSDITSHVALDACAAAGAEAGATSSWLTTQRAALRALGLRADLPAREMAASAPADYLAAVGRASEAVELMALDGLGAFGWLVQAVGDVRLPQLLTGTDW